MAYHIYTSAVFILKVTPRGETNSDVLMFSKTLGIVNVRAQGIRTMASKLRFAIQEYSYAQISIVRGKHGWRLVSAIPGRTFFSTFTTFGTRQRFARACLLIRSMMGIEDTHPMLFNMLYGYADLLASKTLSDQELILAEYVCALRILYQLGYVGDTETLFDIVHTTEWNQTMLTDVTYGVKDMIALINSSLHQSQLQ